MKIVPIDLFLKLMFNIVIDYMNVAFIYSFYLKIREIEKFENLVAILHAKKEYVIHIANLKQVLNHWLVLKKKHRVIKFNQKWKKKKKIFKKNFLSWWIIQFSKRTMKNIRRNTDVKLKLQTEATWSYLISEPNYHTEKSFSKDLLAIEKNIKQMLMSKPVYLGLSILECK